MINDNKLGYCHISTIIAVCFQKIFKVSAESLIPAGDRHLSPTLLRIVLYSLTNSSWQICRAGLEKT